MPHFRNYTAIRKKLRLICDTITVCPPPPSLSLSLSQKKKKKKKYNDLQVNIDMLAILFFEQLQELSVVEEFGA